MYVCMKQIQHEKETFYDMNFLSFFILLCQNRERRKLNKVRGGESPYIYHTNKCNPHDN